MIWFPATTTFTPQPIPTHLPTPQRLVGVGGIIAADDFGQTGHWNTANSDQGVASIGRNRLTLSVQPGVYLISLHTDIMASDFYAEITAHPSLCRGQDEYGLLVRANAVTYYRFSLTCNGMAHAERVSVAERHVLQEPVPSGDVPLGAPGEVRIGVWAAGPELRFFLNDRYQFSAADFNLASGTVGVFVRAASDTPVTVAFSDLIVRSVQYAPPTATP
ncbi:MAG: hypothetical protein Fur0043_26590 [Anaerolineales bacterium]